MARLQNVLVICRIPVESKVERTFLWNWFPSLTSALTTSCYQICASIWPRTGSSVTCKLFIWKLLAYFIATGLPACARLVHQTDDRLLRYDQLYKSAVCLEKILSVFNQLFRIQPTFPYSTNVSVFNQRFRIQPTFPYSTNVSVFNQRFRIQPTFPYSTNVFVFNQRFRILTTFSYLTNVFVFNQRFRI